LSALDSNEALLLEAVEAAACRQIYAAAPSGLASSLGIRTAEVEGATLLIASGIPDPFFNRAIGLGVHRPATEAALDRVIAVYRAAGCSNWWLHLTPGAQPEALAGWLTARGFAPPARRSWAKMLRGTEPPPRFASALKVREAKATEFAATADAICRAYGMPPAFVPWFESLSRRRNWRTYAALDGDEVVGAGLLYLDRTHAWLGAGGVRREYRGRNAHRQLMALRIADAIAAGCTRITTETGEPVNDEPNASLANMQRCGFRKAYSRLNYTPAG
jgi:hypothetical protein